MNRVLLAVMGWDGKMAPRRRVLQALKKKEFRFSASTKNWQTGSPQQHQKWIGSGEVHEIQIILEPKLGVSTDNFCASFLSRKTRVKFELMATRSLSDGRLWCRYRRK